MDNIIIIADRKSAKNGLRASLSSFGISLIIFVVDLIFHIIRTNNKTEQPWELVIFIISCVFLGLSTLALLFNYSNYKTNNKLINTPLLSYDNSTNELIYYDFAENKEKRILIDKFVSFEILDTNDEAYLKFMENEKNKSTFIGYSSKDNESNINEKIKQYIK